MPKATAPLAIAATLFAFQSVIPLAAAAAQEAMEKKSYNYSAWTPGIFSEAVTITNMGKGKFLSSPALARKTRTARAARSATGATSRRNAPTPTTRSSGRWRRMDRASRTRSR
jgi:hypothetical protein